MEMMLGPASHASQGPWPQEPRASIALRGASGEPGPWAQTVARDRKGRDGPIRIPAFGRAFCALGQQHGGCAGHTRTKRRVSCVMLLAKGEKCPPPVAQRRFPSMRRILDQSVPSFCPRITFNGPSRRNGHAPMSLALFLLPSPHFVILDEAATKWLAVPARWTSPARSRGTR